MSKYLSSLLGSQNIKSILGTSVSGIKSVFGVEVLNLPLGTIIMYHGTGVSSPTTKSTEISLSNGDSFDMKGWYVCNNQTISDYGLGSSTNLIDKFLRFDMEAGGQTMSAGNANAPYIAHSHSLASAGAHTHSTGNENTRHRHTFCYWWGYGLAGMPSGTPYTFYNQKTSTSNNHSHTSGYAGSHSNHSIGYSGSSAYTDKNAPECRTLIFLERLRIDDYKLPLGIVLMYHGTAISDVGGKGSDLSGELGMPGWYVANGVKSGTVNMIDKFARSKMSVATGTAEGTNNVTLRYHNHTANASSPSTHQHTSDTKTHTHGFPGYVNYAGYYVGSGGSFTYNTGMPGSGNFFGDTNVYSSYDGDHTHTCNNCASHYHTISTVGDNNGVGYNIPAYKTLIFIQKVEQS